MKKPSKLRLVEPSNSRFSAPVAELLRHTPAITSKLLRYAFAHFPEDAEDLFGPITPDEPELEFIVPWMLFHTDFDGGRLPELCLEDPRLKLPAGERATLEAEAQAWLGVWHVTSLMPGASITATDLLTGESRVVEEQSSSMSVSVGQSVLARVVDFKGVSVFAGHYSRALGLAAAKAVAKKMCQQVGCKKVIPAECLRDEETTGFLIDAWEDALNAGVESDEPPPEAIAAIMQQVLFDHYATWPDHPLPALNNRTPRSACKSAAGRRQVAKLLDDMEQRSNLTGMDVTAAFAHLREKLGLVQGQ